MNTFEADLKNLLMSIIAWTTIIVALIFLAFKSGDIYNTIRDMVKTWKGG